MKIGFKKTCGTIVSLLLVTLFTSAQAQSFAPVNLGSTDSCLILKMNGERVPFPLQHANTKFALAEGETYLLNGTLVLLSGKVFLNVDLTSQPWLATADVKANPYFEVDSMDAVSIHHFSGKFVQMAVIAKTASSDGSTLAPAMKLSSILPPAINE